MIRFLHRQHEIALEDVPADTTVLEYLREQRGLCGTKEGCASGDCGACTVVTARPAGDGLCYEPMNACIATLGSLHGAQLITVEDLKDGTTWHPVQRAMIDCHGSQCGFCTPGFVMSLFALFHNAGTASHEDILEALGGNLCRCTGYRPIVDAARRALAGSREDQFTQREKNTFEQLQALADTESEAVALQHGSGHYYRPASAEAVASLLEQHPEARVLAGGTDLLLEVTQDLKALPLLIDLRAVAELADIHVDEDAIHLGAAVTHRACQPAVLAEFPELAELIERFGSLQIRSQGTLAGNIATASPIGDWPPVLLALGARLRLQSIRGCRELPLEDFFLDYRDTELAGDEFIRAVIIPKRPPGLLLRAYKISKRFEDDISSVCAVFALHMQNNMVRDARVAFGGMAAIPKRAPRVEEALRGLDLQRDSLEAACQAVAEDFQPISDARATGAYRLTVAARLIERLRHEYCQRGPTRVHPLGQAQARQATQALTDVG